MRNIRRYLFRTFQRRYWSAAAALAVPLAAGLAVAGAEPARQPVEPQAGPPGYQNPDRGTQDTGFRPSRKTPKPTLRAPRR